MSSVRDWFDSPGRQFGVALTVALVAGAAFLMLRGGGDDDEAGTAAGEGSATTVSAGELPDLAEELARPIYWVGPIEEHLYEVRVTPTNRVFLRYLPQDADEEGNDEVLTVGAYPLEDPLDAIRGAAEAEGATLIELPDGGEAVATESQSTSVHLSFPDAEHQIEVYHPIPGRAQELVEAGRVERIE